MVSGLSPVAGKAGSKGGPPRPRTPLPQRSCAAAAAAHPDGKQTSRRCHCHTPDIVGRVLAEDVADQALVVQGLQRDCAAARGN